MAFLGSNIIIGKSEKELNDLLDNLKELEKQKKRSAFKSWFNLIEEAGLTNLTQEDIRNKHLSIIKERIGDI